MFRMTFATWDSYGRPTSGMMDYLIPMPSEKCLGMNVTYTYDDAAHIVQMNSSGGTNYSMIGAHWCTVGATTDTTRFDTNMIMVKATHQLSLGTSTDDFTTQA